jgi:aminoglycoside phosphotransferase (APT) family kinase protein
LDWEDAAYGDPLSDVACTALELRYVVGADGAERFLQAYQDLKTLDRPRLALWQLYVAAAAHHAMGSWGLDADREAHMRKTALTAIREASRLVI